MQLTDYAVYKDNNEPWTLDELNLIATSMGDDKYSGAIPKSKYVYQIHCNSQVLAWSSQDIKNKTPIKYSEYVKLVNSYLTEEELITWESITTYKKFTVNCDMIRIGTSVKGIRLNQTYKLLAIYRHKRSNSSICFAIKDNLGNIRKWTSNTMWKLKSYEKITKQEKPMVNRTGKYLSLKINNGEANTRSLIFQANATGINDPRPFIKELINQEIKSLKQTLNDIDLYSIEYGYNVKLASLVTFGKKLQQQLYTDINYKPSLQECINVYTLLDELEQFHRAKKIHEEMKLQWIAPYIWIKDYLTPSVLSVPKPKVLFNSNKFKLHIKDGCIYFLDKKPKIEYKAEIKLDVKSNTYYI